MSRGKMFSQVLYAVLHIMILWMFTTEVVLAQKIKVACVGNSVTYGYNIDNPKLYSYPAQLQKLLGDAFEVANFGKSGATLLQKGHRPYMEQNEFREAVKFQPDILIVSLGLNDTDPRNWPNYRDEFVTDYMALIDSVKKSDGTQPELYVGRMTPIFHWHPRFKSGTRDWFWQIQEAIGQVAFNCKANIIDWHSPLHARPNLFPDALHPTKEGASIMARLAYQHLTGDFGGLQMASVFGDHMVLQRNKPIPVWGKANGAEKISVEFNGAKAEATTGTDGRWHLELPAMKHGGPFELKINSTNEEIVFENVMIGEVWLCAGQSNMAFKLSESTFGAEELKNKMPSQLRLMNFRQSAYTNDMAWDKAMLDHVNNLNYLSGQWHMPNTETIADFSAIAWYFGKELESELDVAIGLIQLAVGGSPAESWVDRKTLEFNPHLVNMLYDWQNNDHTMLWCRQRAMINIKKSDDPMQRHPYQPAYLFEAGIEQIAGFSIKGVLWYQGESNAHNIELHEVLFPTLIQSWRDVWEQPNLPFYFAQLSSLNRPSWPHFRDSQRRMANQLANVSMVVTSDLGNETDVHPKQKKQVGERFAHLALHQLYGTEATPQGNIKIEKVESTIDELRISFTNTNRLKISEENELHELEVAGEDGLFHPVRAILKGNQLIVKTKGQFIKAVRYAWKPYSSGNLVNEDGVPVSTFLLEHPFKIL
ncbi:sialate O-acetylesterase [Carboxylicivirga sp. N1Y90]|uniref:sialate O-acetylesterase n=1 Tax=Carboxylicivirga fragile TaxID=3417571 RepID=UPI003D34D1F5|nr:hypothetical protein [Marinilabiliaceae bacterium N1Y90]